MYNDEKYPIEFTLLRLSENHRIKTYNKQYYSLMTLIADRLAIPGFGLCSGMGSCGTCLVAIDNKNVLSCATPVNDELSNTIITVPDKLY